MSDLIHDGQLGPIITDRIELVAALHRVMDDVLAGGGGYATVRNRIRETNVFVKWADQVHASLTLETLSDVYVRWSENLVHRWQVQQRLSQSSAYYLARTVGALFDVALERQKPLLHLTRLTRPSSRKAPVGPQAEKQNLERTFAFGHLLMDVCDSLPLSVIWGGFNVEVHRRNGDVLKLWTGGSAPKRKAEWAKWEVRSSERREQTYIEDRNLRHRGRKAVVNTRILSELLMFIGQTGMNVGQAHQLEVRHYSYASDVDGYTVRAYKPRRQGEVLFKIFSQYRPHFERYLEWRRKLFPQSTELFPVLRDGSRRDSQPRFQVVIDLCKRAGVPWTPPLTLRGTRVNWLLRQTDDATLTADLAQHDKETLLRTYYKPSLQRAMREVTQFWTATDPNLVKDFATGSIAPGECDGVPTPLPEKPRTAPAPDCVHPSGCLWCAHHRDIDTKDYVWAASSFRYLKIVEVGKQCFPSNANSHEHPAQHAVDRLSEKLAWFKNSNATRRGWVETSLALVDEGQYHPDWVGLIEALEGGDL